MFHHTLPQLYALSTQEGKLVLRLEIVAVYRECGSIRETARRLFVSRNTVRMRRYREEGEAGLYDRPRWPKRSPCRTPPEVEGRVLELKRERGWGRRRIARGSPRGRSATSCAATYPRKNGVHVRKGGFLPRPVGMGRGGALPVGPGGHQGHPAQRHLGDEASPSTSGPSLKREPGSGFRHEVTASRW